MSDIDKLATKSDEIITGTGNTRKFEKDKHGKIHIL
jgi:hypothetical protein